MKKSIFITVLFFLFIHYSFSQPYHPFPDSSARWSEHGRTMAPSTGGHVNIFGQGWTYSLGNDTIINSVHYSLVGKQPTFFYQLNDNILVAADNYSINEPGQIFGAIREDSFKKVWFRNFNINPTSLPFCAQLESLPSDTEILLYDFDLQIGDSIPWAQPNANFNYKVVTSIDSIFFIDGTFRKGYRLNSGPGGEYWIEGMGSTLGLFGAYMNPSNFVQNLYNCSLSCFWLNEQNVFNISQPISEIECDSTLYYISAAPEDSESVVNSAFIYYSHSEKKIYFSFENKKYENDELILYNRIGQEVFKKKITGNFFNISISTFVTGIYFYNIEDEYSEPLKGKFFID